MRGKIKRLWGSLRRLHAEEVGQGMTEYVLIVVLIAIAVIGVVIVFRNVIGQRFTDSANAIPDVDPDAAGGGP